MPTATKVQAIPTGYRTITPYLVVNGASKLIDFVKKAFGAEERFRMPAPNGNIAHAELKIGDSMLMTADGASEWPPMPSMIHLYVEDCDRFYKQAVAAGATSVHTPEDQFYGDRRAVVKDPCGNVWYMATHVEDVSPAEMEKKMKAMKK